MADPPSRILILTERIARHELHVLANDFFENMVKFVVDIERELIAIGGELHTDAEQLLLTDGSREEDMWGANYYPGRGTDRSIEFTSLINIRPAAGNRSMEIEDARIRDRVREITARLVGTGEEI